jgi:FkbM family methyltransferase
MVAVITIGWDWGMSVNLAAKRMLLRTPAGRVALVARDFLRLVTTPKVAVGTAINDQIAGRLVVSLCPQAGTFVDIGAHIGSVVAEVLFEKPTARIIAFEAIPDKASALRRKFPEVAVHCCALADAEGEQSFYIDANNSGCSSLAKNGGDVQEITVSTKRLDAVLDDDHVDVIKIDVEGAELGVLRGATSIIGRCRPVIMFESGPGNVLGYTKEAMFEFFAERDYGLFAPNRLAHTGGKLTIDAFLDSHEYPRRTTNYFALPDERAMEIRGRAKSIRV